MTLSLGVAFICAVISGALVVAYHLGVATERAQQERWQRHLARLRSESPVIQTTQRGK